MQRGCVPGARAAHVLTPAQGVHAIMTLLEHAIDHTMDTFELYCLRSIFVITPEQTRHMTLEHHRGLDLRPAEARRPEQPRSGESAADVIPAYKDTLRRRILGVSQCEPRQQADRSQARAAQHMLEQAERAAKARLERTQKVSAAYAFIFQRARSTFDVKEAESEAVRGAVLHATADVTQGMRGVIHALDELCAARPLHATLIPAAEKKQEQDLEHPLEERQQWERGRDEYLNWEANRILAQMKRAPGTPHAHR